MTQEVAPEACGSEPPLSLEQIYQKVTSLLTHPFFANEPETVRQAVSLVFASCFLGTNGDKLSKFLGLNRDSARIRAKRLRENGIWNSGSVLLEGETDEEILVGILLAALVAEGRVKVTYPQEQASS